MTDSLLPLFLCETRRRLREDYLGRLRRGLEGLDDQGLWWRPREGANSIANLLLHLEGNLRQWVIHGAGGRADVRERDAEFAARGGAGREELLERLEATIEEALTVVESLPPEAWTEKRVIQGYSETVFSAVYHAVEHFSGHVGQILYVAKMLDEGFPNLYGGDGSGGA